MLGTCAVAYVVIPKPSGIKQGLITSKSRLSKKYSKKPKTKTSISTQHILNLADNIRNSLPNYNVREVHGWSDSAVVFAQLTRRWK